jgi:8-oxo-dGTP pyrophosphatase MutT (NUDIX family)
LKKSIGSKGLIYRGAGVALFHEEGDGLTVLLGRRSVRPAYGKWSFPGGGLNTGETFWDCAQREFLEETGIQLGTLKPVPAGTLKINFPFFHWGTFLFTVSKKPDRTKPVEFSVLQWVPLERLQDYPLCFGVKRAIKRFSTLQNSVTR